MSRKPSRARTLPPLHHLQAFEALGRCRGVSAAAAAIGLTRDGIEESLKALESRLGIKLVASLAPVVTLTSAGEAYFHAVQDFSRELEDELYLRFAAGRTRLRVTAAQAIARLWLEPRIAGFRERHPRIDLSVTASERVHDVADGGYDVALRYGDSTGDGLVAVALWRDVHVAAAAPGLAARIAGLSPAELPMAVPVLEHAVASWRHWLDSLAAPATAINAVLTCADLHLAIEAACEGMGVVLAPSRLLAAKLEGGALCRVTAHAAPGRTYHAVVATRQAARPPVRAFLAWLAEEAA